jgi:hypothetical protein
MTSRRPSKIVPMRSPHSPRDIRHGGDIDAHFFRFHALQLKMTSAILALDILANMAFGSHTPRLALVPDILQIGRGSTLRFFGLIGVFGVCKGPFRRNDGLAPLLRVVGSVDLEGVGWEDGEG